MVNRQLQDDMIQKVNDIFASYRPDQQELILSELEALGFVRAGGNPAAISMENTQMELFLVIGVDEKGSLVSNEIVTFDQIAKNG
jgi:hypothetical protein